MSPDDLNQYRNMMQNVAHRILRNDSDAEDAVQTALLLALKSGDSFANKYNCSLPAWLKKITVNVALDTRRIRRRRPEESMPDAASQNWIPARLQVSDSPDSRLYAEWVQGIVEGYVNSLESAFHRDVLRLRIFSGMSWSEVAGTLDRNEVSCKVALMRHGRLIIRHVRRASMAHASVKRIVEDKPQQ
jgi:RNA polymerase sigma factor (sigma-70 family)